MSIFDGFKFVIVIVVILLIGGGYWHYRNVVANLRDAEAANAILTNQRERHLDGECQCTGGCQG